MLEVAADLGRNGGVPFHYVTVPSVRVSRTPWFLDDQWRDHRSEMLGVSPFASIAPNAPSESRKHRSELVEGPGAGNQWRVGRVETAIYAPPLPAASTAARSCSATRAGE